MNEQKSKKKSPTSLKTRRRTPSLRARKAFSYFLENRGKSLSASMRAAGFSEAYSKNPQQLTQTKSWEEWTCEELSDALLIKTNLGLLKHKNWRAQDAGLDKAYKIRGKYAPEQVELTKRKYQDLSNAELAALERKLKDFLLKR